MSRGSPSPKRQGRGTLGIGLTLIILAGALATGLVYGGYIPLATTLSSWNPHVTCTPTLVRITDITRNQTEPATSTSPYGPFATSNPSKRWLSSPGPVPTGWTSPGPPCAVGAQAVFVEIDGIKKSASTYEDCQLSYDTINGGTALPAGHWCDTTGNIYDPNLVANYGTSCTVATDPTCYGRIHVEFDSNWMADNEAGPNSGVAASNNNTWAAQASTQLLDVQGFVFWDNVHTNVQWHSFNGWELHALTAWRTHVITPPPPTMGVAFTTSPTTGVANQIMTFSGSVAGGTAPYNYSWTFGDGFRYTSSSASTTKIYATAGTYSASLTVTDSSNPKLSATANAQITVVNPTPTLTASFAATPTSASVGSTISFSSTISGGVPPYTVTWNFGDTFVGTGTTTSHVYAQPGTFTVSMTVTDTASPQNSAASTGTVTITQQNPAQLTASITWSPTIAITGQPVYFNGIVTGGTPPYVLGWNFGDGSSTGDGGTTPVHTFIMPGVFNVTLIVTDSGSRQTTTVSSILVQNPIGTGGTGGNGFIALLYQNLPIVAAASLGFGIGGIGLSAIGIRKGRGPRGPAQR